MSFSVVKLLLLGLELLYVLTYLLRLLILHTLVMPCPTLWVLAPHPLSFMSFYQIYISLHSNPCDNRISEE
jgi:hypothetical protein